MGTELTDAELDRFLFDQGSGHMSCCESKGRPCQQGDESGAAHIHNRNNARAKINVGAVAEHVPTENRFQVDVAHTKDGVARHGSTLSGQNSTALMQASGAWGKDGVIIANAV